MHRVSGFRRTGRSVAISDTADSYRSSALFTLVGIAGEDDLDAPDLNETHATVGNRQRSTGDEDKLGATIFATEEHACSFGYKPVGDFTVKTELKWWENIKIDALAAAECL